MSNEWFKIEGNKISDTNSFKVTIQIGKPIPEDKIESYREINGAEIAAIIVIMTFLSSLFSLWRQR